MTTTTLQFTEKEITEFQRLFKERYRRKLTKDDAVDRVARLVNLIKALYLSPESQEHQRTKKRNKLHLDLDSKEDHKESQDSKNKKRYYIEVINEL